MNAKQIWFAEDIALAMEMIDKLKSEAEGRIKAIEIVAAKFGVAHATLREMLMKARNNGFDAYPVRGDK